jgi:hypothetical protein
VLSANEVESTIISLQAFLFTDENEWYLHIHFYNKYRLICYCVAYYVKLNVQFFCVLPLVLFFSVEKNDDGLLGL